jgi:branched-chain amino acid transport system permease protein
MADTMTTTPTDEGPPTLPTTPPAIDWRRVLQVGAIGALAMAFIAMIGMYAAFDRRLLIVPVLSLGALVYFGVPLTVGYLAGSFKEVPGQASRRHGPVDVLAGAVAGLISALGPLFLVYLLGTELNLRQTFVNASPALRQLLLFDQEVGTGSLYLLAASVGAGILGGSFHLIPARARRALVIGLETVVILSLLELIMRQFLGNVGLSALHRALWVTNSGLRLVPSVVLLVVATGLAYVLAGRGAQARSSLIQRSQESKAKGTIAAVLVLIAIVIVPTLVGSLVNELFVNVGLFLLMALGLNIVIGYAGLLHLGYVAFFAVGAYGMAILTSPLSPAYAPNLTWWLALPIVIGLATIAGLLIGAPVIGLRGDYLAIVTLGFGEIIRILFLSSWLGPYFGGAQGVQRVPGVDFGVVEVRGVNPQQMFYVVAAFVLLAAYSSWRLQNSRIGRAWSALREDETTAEVMGIDTAKAKLLAFVIGSIIASFAGALFASKVGSVFPSSFDLLVSIIVLVVVIVGGMGHIPGVIVGAIVLIGILGGPTQPGLLQELGEYKLLIYGAILVYMMLQKPEGLVPSVRRSRELHGEEAQQDAWFDKKGNLTDTEAAAIEADLVESGADPSGDDAPAVPQAPTGGDA